MSAADAQRARRDDARRQAETVAKRMEAAASRIRQLGQSLERDPVPGRDRTASVVADMVQEFLTVGSNVGPLFWNMIDNLRDGAS